MNETVGGASGGSAVSVPIGRQITVPVDQIYRNPLCGGRGQLTASSVTLYTAPNVSSPTGNTQGALLKSIILCNTDTSARTVTIYLIESGGSVADNRAILKDLTIAAKTTHTEFYPDDTCPLASGETVRGLASLTAVITYRISVVERT